MKKLVLEKTVSLELLHQNYYYNPHTGQIYRLTLNKYKYPLRNINSRGYNLIKIRGKNYPAHQVAFYMVHGLLPRLPYTIDHINGNKQDNRIRNLRIADRTLQNINTIRLRGATHRKDTGRWEARIQIRKKRYSLGTYTSKKDAYGAYNRALRRFKMPSDCLNKFKKRS